jgi:sensor histidine kinase YesM
MSVIDFLCRNFVTVSLAVVTIIVTLLFRKQKDFKAYVMYSLIGLTIVLSILTYIEWGLGLLEVGEYTEATIQARIALSFICYILRPTIIYVIMLLGNIKTHKQAWLLSIPWFINLALYQTCFYSDIVFTISPTNHFDPGPLRSTCLIVSVTYLVILLAYTIILYRNKANRFLFVLLIATYIICIIGAFLDSLSGEYSILCNIIAVCIFAYTLFNVFAQKVDEEKKIYENLNEQRRLLMLSQIQPHFMYNTLNTIYYLCKTDPALAADTVKNFSDYLRVNMDSIDKQGPVSVRDEIKHTETYVNICKLRFENIKVNFDIEDDDFKVPALTIQPLVENAIKHGVRELDEGIINVSIYKKGEDYYVEVKDNGVGFNVNEKKDDGRNHIGLKNVKERIESSGFGEVKIESEINKGTRIVAHYFGNKQPK